MINRITIRYLYKHTHRPKDGFHDSLLRKVADCCREHFKVAFEDGCMIVGVLDYDNPFRRIRLSCIKGFKIVDNEVAVVIGAVHTVFQQQHRGDKNKFPL